MFAEMILIYLPFARQSSLSRPASLDLGVFTNPSEMRLFTSLSRLITAHRAGRQSGSWLKSFQSTWFASGKARLRQRSAPEKKRRPFRLRFRILSY